MNEKHRQAAPAKKNFLRLIPMLAIMALIFWLSHQPGDQIELPSLPFVDKVGHGIIYGVLALSIVWIPRGRHSKKKALMIAVSGVLIASLYGMSDEWHQSFIPGREASLGDLAADACGALFACSLWLHHQSRAFLSR